MIARFCDGRSVVVKADLERAAISDIPSYLNKSQNAEIIAEIKRSIRQRTQKEAEILGVDRTEELIKAQHELHRILPNKLKHQANTNHVQVISLLIRLKFAVILLLSAGLELF
jgi:hypothetical protein